jgi:hypothetical protein
VEPLSPRPVKIEQSGSGTLHKAVHTHELRNEFVEELNPNLGLTEYGLVGGETNVSVPCAGYLGHPFKDWRRAPRQSLVSHLVFTKRGMEQEHREQVNLCLLNTDTPPLTTKQREDACSSSVERKQDREDRKHVRPLRWPPQDVGSPSLTLHKYAFSGLCRSLVVMV